jgi:hypothetical protein
MSTPAALLAQQTAKIPRPATIAAFDAVSKAVAGVPINGQRVAKLPAPVKPKSAAAAAAAPPPPPPALTEDEERAAVEKLADAGEQFSDVDTDSAAGDDAEASHDEAAGGAANGDEEDRANEPELTGDAEHATDPQKLDADGDAEAAAAADDAVESHDFAVIG